MSLLSSYKAKDSIFDATQKFTSLGKFVSDAKIFMNGLIQMESVTLNLMNFISVGDPLCLAFLLFPGLKFIP